MFVHLAKVSHCAILNLHNFTPFCPSRSLGPSSRSNFIYTEEFFRFSLEECLRLLQGIKKGCNDRVSPGVTALHSRRSVNGLNFVHCTKLFLLDSKEPSLPIVLCGHTPISDGLKIKFFSSRHHIDSNQKINHRSCIERKFFT